MKLPTESNNTNFFNEEFLGEPPENSFELCEYCTPSEVFVMEIEDWARRSQKQARRNSPYCKFSGRYDPGS